MDSTLTAENAALHFQVQWLRIYLDQVWDMCRVAQKVVQDLDNTGGLTTAGQVILQAAPVRDCISRCPFYRWLEDWLHSVHSDVDEGDAVSIMAGILANSPDCGLETSGYPAQTTPAESAVTSSPTGGTGEKPTLQSRT